MTTAEQRAAAAIRRVYVDNARQTLADVEAIDWNTVTDRDLAVMVGSLAQAVAFLLNVIDKQDGAAS